MRDLRHARRCDLRDRIEVERPHRGDCARREQGDPSLVIPRRSRDHERHIDIALNKSYVWLNVVEMPMTEGASRKDDSDEAIAHRRNKLVREHARAAGLLGAAKDTRVSGRVPASLLEAAKKRAHVASDTELLEIALSRLALEDDFGVRLLRRKGAIPPSVDLEF